jgi:pimeloyl-ACP methyl ester carboxylesterase
MLVGHSQGGLIALDLAKRSIAGQVPFRVERVITFGTPAGSNRAIDLPNVLSIENRADLVPKLELRENPSGQNWLTLEGNVDTDLVSAHRMESYEQIVAKLGANVENKRQIEGIERFATSVAKVRYFELGQR